jgi:hypothetical protein
MTCVRVDSVPKVLWGFDSDRVHFSEWACADRNRFVVQVISADRFAAFVVSDAIGYFDLGGGLLFRIQRAGHSIRHNIGYHIIVSKKHPVQAAIRNCITHGALIVELVLNELRGDL